MNDHTNHSTSDNTSNESGRGESKMNRSDKIDQSAPNPNETNLSDASEGVTARPMDTRNFAIGILSVTATILLTGLLVIGTRPAPVLADGMSVTGGDYVMLVGAYEQVNEEFVYLIDAPTERIIAYRFNAGRNQIEIVQGIDFGKIRQAAEKKQPGRP